MSCPGIILIALLVIFSGVIQSALKVSGTEVDLKVRPGNNVTLHCDCTWEVGFTTAWFRNCSHYRQPSFITLPRATNNDMSPILRYMFQWNSSSRSHDLVIENITESDLGLYYCSASKTEVTDEAKIEQKRIHHFGNISYKLSFEDITPSLPPTSPPPDCGQCWMLLVSLCPVCALLSALISSTCVYCCCRKTAPMESGVHLGKRESWKGEQDENKELCYASLDIPTKACKAKAKKKRHQTSDFSTYSEVKTHRIRT